MKPEDLQKNYKNNFWMSVSRGAATAFLQSALKIKEFAVRSWQKQG
jgi:hypothetical protein